MSGMPATVTASAERSIAIAGDVTNSVIVSGDNNTVQLRVDGDSALLAGVLTGSHVPRISLRALPLLGLPPPSREHVDRDAEGQAVRAGLGVGRAFEISGVRDIGKTYVVRHALAGARDMPDGSVYVFAKGRPYADVVQELHEAFYASHPPVVVGPQQIRVDLASRRALVVLDSVTLDRDELRQLVTLLPCCQVVFVSRDRMGLGEGGRLVVGGLPSDHAIEVIEQELGRALDADERPAAERLITQLGGHPHHLRQLAAAVRDGERSFTQQAAALELSPRVPGDDGALADLLVASLSDQDAELLEQLAALRGAIVGVEHVAALAGVADALPALRRLELRRLVASGSPRFRIAGALHALSDERRAAITIRATQHFSSWARARRSRPATILQEAPAILELIACATAEGRDADVIALGRASDAGFAWGRRWGAWGAVLETVLAAAQRSHDRSAHAWALHQLGTRAYCLGDRAAATGALAEALHIREGLGDAGGAAATRYNLEFIANPPTTGGDGGGDRAPRLPGGYPPVLLAILLALVAGVGTVGAVTLIQDDPPPGSAQADHTAPGTPRPPGQTIPRHTSTSATVVTSPAGHPAAGDTTTPRPSTPGGRPKVDVDETVEFGTQPTGTTSDAKAVVVTNVGTRTLGVTSVDVTGDDAADFSADDYGGCSDVAPLQTCTISVSFAPAGSARRDARLEIVSNAPGSPHDVALVGEGEPVAQFSAVKTVRFTTPEILKVQRSASRDAQKIEVSNGGEPGSQLRFTSDPKLGGDDPSSYDISARTCDQTRSLAAGETCTVTVTFQPSSDTPTATLEFSTDAPGSPHTIELTGPR